MQVPDPNGLAPLVNQIGQAKDCQPLKPLPLFPRLPPKAAGGGRGDLGAALALACQTDSPSRQAGWGLLSHNLFLNSELR